MVNQSLINGPGAKGERPVSSKTDPGKTGCLLTEETEPSPQNAPKTRNYKRIRGEHGRNFLTLTSAVIFLT